MTDNEMNDWLDSFVSKNFRSPVKFPVPGKKVAFIVDEEQAEALMLLRADARPELYPMYQYHDFVLNYLKPVIEEYLYELIDAKTLRNIDIRAAAATKALGISEFHFSAVPSKTRPGVVEFDAIEVHPLVYVFPYPLIRRAIGDNDSPARRHLVEDVLSQPGVYLRAI